MGPDAKPQRGGRVKRAPAVVRAWDGPNSRIAFEMDLDQMPWGPFEALGKKVTVLIPEESAEAAGAPSESGDSVTSQLERALRHVEHAAAKCAEFAQFENGGDQLWRKSLETWEWLRDHLQALWTETEPHPADASGKGGEPALPTMPGAAATLEVAAAALRQTPLASWRDAIGTFSPDAPTREEAIQTLLGVARLLAHAPPHPAGENSLPPDAQGADPGAVPAAPPAEAQAAEPGGAEGPEAGELSYDYAAGYDEGYQMGRKVGRALASRTKPGRRR